MNPKVRLRCGQLGTVLLVFWIGCGVVWGAGTYDGHWYGTTNQAQDMDFVVVDDRVTEFTIKLSVKGSVCTVTQSGTVRLSPGAAIVKGSFKITSTIEQFEYNGTFSSPTACSGTWDKSHDHCQATGDGSWMATRDFVQYIPKSGIWKSGDGVLSLYLQKYGTGSCVVVVTMGDSMYTAFLDQDYADGIHVTNDVDGRGYSLDIILDSDSSGTIAVTLPGFGTVTKAISLVFEDV